MSEVMKKRLIGLLILIIIAILIPVLLSQCKHESTGNSSGGDMRVYDIQPDGDTTLVSNNENGAEEQPEDESESSSETKEDNAGTEQGQITDNSFGTVENEGSKSGKSEFSTPPVHGKSGVQGVAGNPPKDKQATSQQQAQAEKNQSAKTASNGENTRKKQEKSSQSSDAGKPHGSTQKTAQPKPKVAEGAKENEVHGWVVQIGSFSKSANAASAVKQVGQSQQASYSQVEVNGKSYYHVYVGPFDNEEAAKSAAAKLKKSGHNTLVRNLP